MSEYELLTEEIVDQMENASPDERHFWLIVSRHPRYSERWAVEGLESSFFFDFEDIVGQYRAIRIDQIRSLLERAGELDYRVVFVDDPSDVVKQKKALDEPPPFSLNSNLEGTINGALPYQINGYNYLKNPELKAGFAHWSTGTGKSAFEFMFIKHHMEYQDDADICFVVVKPNNKVDTQKKAKALADIESIILDGTPEKRAKIYEDIDERLANGEKVVVITNYEKFKDDQAQIARLFDGTRMLVFWDEMPTKLRNRNTQLYQSVATCLYGGPLRISWRNKRPKWLRQYMLTATPLENGPVDILNCIRLIDPTLFPKIKEWEKQFVVQRDQFTKEPSAFRHLELMGMQLEFMMHTVDKTDPEIAKMFPKNIEDTVYIDWTSKSRALYDKLQSIAGKLTEEEEEEISIFSLIMILQMLCDAPEMVALSASNHEKFLEYLEEYGEDAGYSGPIGSESALMLADALPDKITNDGHPKLEFLKYLLLEKHPGEKTIMFSTFSSYIFPSLEKLFDEWGVTYTTYKGTAKQREKAKNDFRADPDIQVFLSSDAGSDSIDLPEARVVVHYNLPWKDSTKTQRQNRASRVNSQHTRIYIYTLVMEGSVEDRKMEIIARKRGYNDAIFNGGKDIGSHRLSADDMMYILLGE